MYKVGITGGIGSGKSTICQIFQILGIPIYDADSRSKILLKENQHVKDAVIDAFGEQSYESDGSVNRTFLGERVFSNVEALEQLNAIVHPAVRADLEKWLEHQNAPYVIKEAAILIESGAYKDLDEIIAVEADINTRIERVMERDGIEKSKVEERVRAQITDEERRSHATHIIDNNNNQLLIPQVLKIHENIISRAGS